MGNDCNICSNKCMGFTGNHGGCCTIADRDFIIGPHLDSETFINKISKKIGRKVSYKEIFVDFEEGKTLFQDKSMWQMEENYPAIRVDFFNYLFPCIFYNTKIRACMV